MKCFPILAVATILAIHCSLGHAAVFTSTTTLNQSHTRSFFPTTRLTDEIAKVDESRTYVTSISSGVNTASFSADTTADNGTITGFAFKSIGLPGPTNFTRSVTAKRLVVDVPADFPNPPVTHIESFTFQERVVFDTQTSVTPMFASSTTNSLFSIPYYSPWFQMTNELTLAPISFAIKGTYEAIGPTTTKSFPFSVTYEAIGGLTAVQRTGIQGGANFGNGFQALPSRDMNLSFRTLTPAVINEEVDGMRFRMSFPESVFLPLLRGIPIPEPSSAALLAIAAAAARPRHKRRCRALPSNM